MRFNEIQSRNQLADFVDIQRKTLTYVLFEAKVDSFYSSFDIPKKMVLHAIFLLLLVR